VLRLKDVSALRDGRKVLDRVSLEIGAGQVVVVQGARAAGKSTLLAVAAAAERPPSGAVFFAGRNLMDLQASSWPYVRRNVGYLPPEPPLIRDETALENVLLALAVRGDDVGTAKDAALAALADVGLENAAQEPVHALSRGARHLVALARALAGQPALVVLDEPAAGLSPDDRDTIASALFLAAGRGAGVLCGSADAAFVQILERTGAERLRLEQGRLTGGAPRMRLVSPLTSPIVGPDGEAAIATAQDEEELSEADLEATTDGEGVAAPGPRPAFPQVPMGKTRP
jgi:ABC-type ATPase involved in cell division